MNSLLLFLVVSIIYSNQNNFNSCKCTIPLKITFLDDSTFWIDVPIKCGDTLISTNNTGNQLKLVLTDCVGMGTASEYYPNGKLHIKCNFVNSLDTLKEYLKISDLEGNETSIRVLKYFQPLPDGEMYEYDKKGKLINRRIYKNGLLKDKTSF